jgi:hypothetical protein
MKYIFLICTILALLCAGVSEFTEEKLAWGAASCFAITSLMLAIKNDKLSKEEGDEGR